MSLPDIYTRKMIDVLSPELKKTLDHFKKITAYKYCGCTREDNFKGLGIIPPAPMARYPVFRADETRGTYNHQPSLTRWNGKYYLLWCNCAENEGDPGQRILSSCSEDGMKWSEPILVADGSVEKGTLRNLGGLYPTKSKLYAFIQKEWDLSKAVNPEMNIHDDGKISYSNDLFETDDGINWKCIQKKNFDLRRMFDNPHTTAEGRIMGPATSHEKKPGVVLWPGNNPEEKPEIIYIPYAVKNIEDYYSGHDEGKFSYGEASWYQQDNGRIWLWHRDDSASCRLGIAISEDGGRTWTEVMRSNFPDSTSKINVGRLNDGRFFLVGNSTYQLMDRNFFAISLSQDGAKFDRMYRLIEEAAEQRFGGHLKAHGFQYPSCLVDNEKLLIAYSVNKEDIELGILNVKDI